MQIILKSLFLDQWIKSGKCLKHVLANSFCLSETVCPGCLDSNLCLRVGVDVVKGGTTLAIFLQAIQSNNII